MEFIELEELVDMETEKSAFPAIRGENGLPEGWEIKKLGEVADYLNGRAFKPTEWKEKGNPIIRIQNLNNPSAKYNYTEAEFEDRYKVKNGDLLFAWSASLGAYIWNGENAWLNQHIFKVVPKSFTDKKFLFYLLEKITAELYAKAHGSGMVHVTKGKFEATEIPFPHISEQQKIVSKIEELFSELDKGKQQLETAREQLKIYRQSVLKWAFEGKHAINWRETQLNNLCDSKRGISYGVIKLGEVAENGIPCLRTSDVRLLKITTDSVKRISPAISNNYQRTILDGGEVLVNIRGTLGGVAVVNKNMKGWNVSREIAVVPLLNEVLPEFIAYQIASNKCQNWLNGVTKGIAYSGINLQDLRNLPIVFPHISEQQKIVEEIESRLSVADKVEETISQSLQQAETLRQSILKQAFEGKLI